MRKDASLLKPKGVAILMVMTSVTLLAFILSEFTFEVLLNKIKVYHYQDKSQARLNAESGLKFALARLQIYKEARNALEKKPDLKKQYGIQILNQLYEVPFIYPIPITEDMSLIQKAPLQKFQESIKLRGEVNTFISNASHLINLNLLRVHSVRNLEKEEPKEGEDPEEDSQPDQSEQEKALFEVEKKLIDLLTNAINSKLENDEYFEDRHPDLRPDLLIKKIRYYVNPKASFDDPDFLDIERDFQDARIEPKFAPMNSLSELYTIPGWSDELVSLIIGEVTIHGSLAIDLNKITDKTLKLLIDDMEEEQVKEFFQLRDDPQNPRYFDTTDQFVSFVVGQGYIDEETIKKRFDEFKAAGVTFAGSGNLFKVISTGKEGESSYVITAWVSMPVKPPPPPEKVKESDTGSNPAPTPTPTSTKKKKRVIQFLEPRVVELHAN